MATETIPAPRTRRTRGTARRRQHLDSILLVVLANTGLPTATATATAASTGCGSVHFTHPASDLVFFRHDTINVTYKSSFAHPSLVCLCGQGGRVSEKFRLDNAAPFAASEAVLLDFDSVDPCWFHLEPDPADPATSPDLPGGRPGLGPGAAAGIGAGVTAIAVAIGAMAAFLYFRRRKKNQPGDLADAIIDHDRRHGRRPPPEKVMGGWDNSSSVATARSDEPLYPAPQPIPDGFPGSMGYDDVRSLHSLHSGTDTHSPTTGPSPSNHTHAAAGYWTERDELSAARLKSQIPVTSYGPNPVTPTLTPRPSSRVDLNLRAGSVSTDSREGIPPMPLIPLMPDYSYTTTQQRRDPSPSQKPAAPIIVSYGPNPSPTVPSHDSYHKQQRPKGPLFELHTIPASHARARDAWDDDDDEPAMTHSAMGPLPPYASTADFYAMEKGAIRKLAEPRAEAELPPTKDGEVVEYELQAGSAGVPQAARRDAAGGHRIDAGPGATLGGGGGGGFREIDEGKFLLSPELVLLKGEKMKMRGKWEKCIAGS
ncbi:hypothetical protein QBC39DRAFT_391069 [Podospora conica]|nr:hypothetical protein QBC39DRAFT_391069 [Schizothecium conicum]